MAIGSTALAHFLIVLIVGIVVGLAVILGLLPTPLMLYLLLSSARSSFCGCGGGADAA